jgi:hypothetical protein
MRKVQDTEIYHFENNNICLFNSYSEIKYELFDTYLKVYPHKNNDEVYLLIYNGSVVNLKKHYEFSEILVVYCFGKSRIKEFHRNSKEVKRGPYSINRVRIDSYATEGSQYTIYFRKVFWYRILLYLIPIVGVYIEAEDGPATYSYAHSLGKRVDTTYATASLLIVFFPFYILWYISYVIKLILYPFFLDKERAQKRSNKQSVLQIYGFDSVMKNIGVIKSIYYEPDRGCFTREEVLNDLGNNELFYDQFCKEIIDEFPLPALPLGMTLYSKQLS